jgi:hypothetical protein
MDRTALATVGGTGVRRLLRLPPMLMVMALVAVAGVEAQTAADSLLLKPLLDAPSQTSLAGLLLPENLSVGYLTRSWVRQSLPPAGTSGLDDLTRLDMIYLRALGESRGDIGLALQASLVATFEHKNIPFTFGIRLPLTLEPEEEFAQRVALLPDLLFADRPKGNDRDKLQHFFASATLAWFSDSRSLADLAGLGIEAGEALFIKGGADDPRDVRANRLGQYFAELLHTYPQALPSALFRAWNREYVGGEVGSD